MNGFKYAHAGGEQGWRNLLAQCLEQLAEIPAQANLGFIYLYDGFAEDIEHILDILKQRTGVTEWVGSVGIGVCATGTEYFDKPAIALMLGEFPEGSFQVFHSVDDHLTDFHQQHADWYRERQALFGVVHADPRSTQLLEMLDVLDDKLDESFLVGGLSSAREHYVQIAGSQQVEQGLSGVLFANENLVMTRLSQGCMPIGERHEVSDCQNNIIARLDNRPALEVWLDDLGADNDADLAALAQQTFAALLIPGSDTGDYMVRNIVGVDPEHQLMAIGDLVSPGSSLMFTRRDPESARADLLQMLDSLKHRLSAPPRGALYFSCLGRGPNLFGPHSAELNLIREHLGDFPLVGFFASGEISHNRLYAYTGVLTLFL